VLEEVILAPQAVKHLIEPAEVADVLAFLSVWSRIDDPGADLAVALASRAPPRRRPVRFG
jgi:hypothetical protein